MTWLLQSSAASPAATGGWEATLLILLLVGVVLLGACAVLLRRQLELSRELAERAPLPLSLPGLEELLSDLARVLARLESSLAQRDSDPVDLERIERTLEEIRDQERKLEVQLVRAIETAAESAEVTLQPPDPESMGERLTNRLLAMSYERIQIVTDSDVLAELSRSDGEARVEAYRHGVLHKGRVIIHAGRITDVDIHPTYSIFP